MYVHVFDYDCGLFVCVCVQRIEAWSADSLPCTILEQISHQELENHWLDSDHKNEPCNVSNKASQAWKQLSRRRRKEPGEENSTTCCTFLHRAGFPGSWGATLQWKFCPYVYIYPQHRSWNGDIQDEGREKLIFTVTYPRQKQCRLHRKTSANVIGIHVERQGLCSLKVTSQYTFTE
jgi:hypothetical protein